jgi:twitching motility protein PilJ
MAFKLPFKLKLPSFDRRTHESPQATVMDVAPDSVVAAPAPAVAANDKRKHSSLPLIGHQSTAVQLQILGAGALFFLVLLVFVLWQQVRAGDVRDVHRTVTADLRVFSHVLAKSAVRVAVQASSDGFDQLTAGRERFNKVIDALSKGGKIGDLEVEAVAGDIRADLDATLKSWEDLNTSLSIVLSQEKGLKTLSDGVERIGKIVTIATRQVGDNPASDAAIRLAQDVFRRSRAMLLLPPPQYLQAASLLRKDFNSMGEAIDKIKKDEQDVKDVLTKAYADIETILTPALDNLPALDQAKKAAVPLQTKSEALAASTDKLFVAVGKTTSDNSATAVIVVSGSMMLVLLVLMLKVFNDDSLSRRLEAERQKAEAEAAKEATQEAILRLMNEMGNLADGDLTVRASVSEDVTGAIADSVNYTIEELSVLVKRINDAATRVSTATDAAQETSAVLLEATERQSKEIQQAGSQVLEMAQSMNDVSGDALESARVARQSLDAAQKGAHAVEDSIKGMNEIRTQIQETSKRIKRLGESSQEIGEIVELISDITEQTNVLALNAAIQAASAGEAGRGFTVVAEEVQRLAERSGEATKQIAAIVKTIQADTHDAVSAMESSTQGVVEGAKLSDAAGQALNEISSVSNNLAQLIEKISTDTQKQAEIATSVAGDMQGILAVTERTTDGTKRTAASVGELSDLAVELKGSVSGFKV